MSGRRLSFAIGAGVVAALAIVVAAVAGNAQVHVGNFYYEDASVGDGKVEATIGDQITFIFDDNGPGTPHTATVDGLFDSGNILAGKTWTTPPLAKAGTFRLYCRNHQAKGHVTTLLIYQTDGSLPGASTTTTAAPATTAPPDTTTTTAGGSAAGAVTTTTVAASKTTTTVARTTTTTAPPGASTTAPPSALSAPPPPPPSDGAEGTASSDTIPSGSGTASVDQQAAAPIRPNSLRGLLRRKPPAGPWTRSIRLALAALAPMLLIGGVAVSRFRAESDTGPQPR